MTVHELGHNWGANHDNVDAAHCEPGGAEGNYSKYPRRPSNEIILFCLVMYRNAVSGEHPNNDKFSSCSRDDIIPKVKQFSDFKITLTHYSLASNVWRSVFPSSIKQYLW